MSGADVSLMWGNGFVWGVAASMALARFYDRTSASPLLNALWAVVFTAITALVVSR